MNRPACPLVRAHGHDAVLITWEDIAALKAAAVPKIGPSKFAGSRDGLLFNALNNELCSSVSLAWCNDPQDQDLYNQQERFKRAYEHLHDTIDGLTSPNLRYSVMLPESYILAIQDNWLLDYAQPRSKTGGRPPEWRKDEFYFNLLVLYRLFSGKSPAGSIGGPTVRFMWAVQAIMRRVLSEVPDKSTDIYASVDALWRLPKQDTFLKDWFKPDNNTVNADGHLEEIRRRVDVHADMIVSAYEKRFANLPDPGNLIRGGFGG
jgi:hypothetical protein